MEEIKKPLRDESFWRAHILSAQQFAGSNFKYCRDHGLVSGQFYEHERKLGFAKKSSIKIQQNVFVQVAPATLPAVSSASLPAQAAQDVARAPTQIPLSSPTKNLPDARWLARFIQELTK